MKGNKGKKAIGEESCPKAQSLARPSAREIGRAHV